MLPPASCSCRHWPIRWHSSSGAVLLLGQSCHKASFARADAPTLAGLVLIGSINGGHTSNLCTLIATASDCNCILPNQLYLSSSEAKGDVALSVLMTMSTTLLCIVATPLLVQRSAASAWDKVLGKA